MAPWLTLETMLVTGLVVIAAGLAVLFAVVAYWSAHNLAAIPNVLPAVIGTCAVAIGTQNILGGFLLAIVSGNEAEFLQARPLPLPDPVMQSLPMIEEPAKRRGRWRRDVT
jgi:hypothetical protein